MKKGTAANLIKQKSQNKKIKNRNGSSKAAENLQNENHKKFKDSKHFVDRIKLAIKSF